MSEFFVRRLIASVPTVFAVTVLVFLMMHAAPGNPAELMLGPFAGPEQVARLTSTLGLDAPLPIQYGRWMAQVAQGDLGTSFSMRVPVMDEVWQKYRATLVLTIAAVALSSLVGISAGALAATFRETFIDQAVMVVALAGLSLPVFWLGMILILVFGIELRWLPTSGAGTPGDLLDFGRHLILPAVSLGAANAGYIARFTRSRLIEVLGEDYIRTSVAKGQSRLVTLGKHAMRNVMIQVVTVQGLQFGYLLGGAVLTETVFSWPGIGTLMLRGILSRDFPIVQGAVLLVSLSFIVVNIAVDLVYSVIDPRVQYS